MNDRYSQVEQYHRAGYEYFPKREELRRALAQAVAEQCVGISAPLWVEFGCGEGEQTAFLLPEIARLGGRLIVTDISSKMVVDVRARFPEEVASGILLPLVGDIFYLVENPESLLRYGKISALVSAWTLHNFSREDRQRLFQRILERGVLGEGGVIGFMDKIPFDDPQERERQWQQQMNVCERMSQKYPKAAQAWVDHETEDWSPKRIMVEGQIISDLGENRFTSRVYAREGVDSVICGILKQMGGI